MSTLCYQFLWMVYLCWFFCFVFLRLVYTMLSVTLDCLFELPLRYSLTFIVYTMLSVSLDCYFLIAHSVFSNVYCIHYVVSFFGFSFVLCFCFVFLRLEYTMLSVTLDCLFLLPLRYSLTFIVYTMLPVTLDCLFLLTLRYSLTFIVYTMLSISLDCPFFHCPFGILYRGLSFFLIAPSVFSNVYYN